jgi:osmotically-inducible protein OsmY
MSAAPASLDEQVSALLAKSPYASTRRLRIETQAGKVVLRGVVPSYYQKQMAQEAVRRLSGVSEVDNQLEVHWGEPTPQV